MLKIKTIKKIIIIIVICLLGWFSVFVTDYLRVTHAFEKPIFAICALGADDGGSGTYKGLGYSIKIKGNFMPEDEFPGVTQAVFSLLGKEIKEVTRE